MVQLSFTLAAAFGLLGGAAAQAPAWGQCGGQGWTGPISCLPGWTCKFLNQYHSQCLPYGFMRAVEDPNFHKYLRSEIINTASDAVLGEPDTAGQFFTENNRLIQVQAIDTVDTRLYATVEPLLDSAVKKLKVSWSRQLPYNGSFVTVNEDTIEWSHPNITRPQNNAFLVCPDQAGNKDLYVNLGPYSYQTPTGCSDVILHKYTGAKATA